MNPYDDRKSRRDRMGIDWEAVVKDTLFFIYIIGVALIFAFALYSLITWAPDVEAMGTALHSLIS